ncbi:MAG: universal stress protein [Candidatus Eisenbacteria bacterium]
MLPTIKKILYCTQLGPNTSYVFRYAYAMARKFGGQIVVLHVVQTLSREQRAFVEGYSGQDSIRRIVDHEEQDAKDRLPKRIQEFCRRELIHEDWHEVVCDILLAEGDPAEQIVQHIETTGADLVVIGASATHSLIERLVGSTAEKVIRNSHVPVLSVQVPEGHQGLTLEN